MKFTLGWLKDHLDTGARADDIAERLTQIGLEIESVVDRATDLEGFVVARVVEAHPHPNADKLKVCLVDAGDAGGRVVQVVCGAPNARAGMKGVFAAVGAFIPGTGVALKKASIRGVDSAGMLLSERELGLSDDHTGIIELPDNASVGAPAVEILGLADPVFDAAVTPNRGDYLGVRGIARELAAAGLGTLKPLAIAPIPGTAESPIRVRMEFSPETANACPYFVGRCIRGVRNRESPKWLKDRLLAVGLRPISALVDITNYLTIDLCRPLHAFDADKVRGDLHVRLARPGETLRALNGREYVLGPEMTVIADDVEPEALGGVMGGERSACTTETTNVFLECALFDPIRTAATGRALNIASDARFRFERGVDPSFLVDGMEMATRMVLELSGGEPSALVVAGAEPPRRSPVPFRPSRIRTLAGVAVPENEARHILAALGFAPEDSGTADRWSVGVPPWRNDVEGEACLVEEVVRIHGYDRIAPVPLERTTPLPKPALDTEQQRRATARRALAARGLVEAVTYSFVSSERAALFGASPASPRLINPISADLDVMRPSLLPNLIAAAGRNADHGVANGALFEVGPQYAGYAPEDQTTVAAGVRFGRTGPRHWAKAPRPTDAFDAKADALALLEALGAPVAKLGLSAEAPAWYHPGRSGAFRLGPQTVLATFGEIHPRVLRRLDIKGPLVAFEVFLDKLPRRKPRGGAGKPRLLLSALQPVERDFAFVVDADVPADAVVRAARDAEPTLIADVRVFDVFAGGELGEGKKSLAVNVVLQPVETTLTDAEIEAIADRIVAGIAQATGGALRA